MVISFVDILNKTFEVNKIQYELDENDVPIDIAICADKDTLEEIEYYSSIGCNIRELDIVEQAILKCTHEALYARLSPFTVTKANRVVYNNY